MISQIQTWRSLLERRSNAFREAQPVRLPSDGRLDNHHLGNWEAAQTHLGICYRCTGTPEAKEDSRGGKYTIINVFSADICSCLGQTYITLQNIRCCHSRVWPLEGALFVPGLPGVQGVCLNEEWMYIQPLWSVCLILMPFLLVLLASVTLKLKLKLTVAAFHHWCYHHDDPDINLRVHQSSRSIDGNTACVYVCFCTTVCYEIFTGHSFLGVFLLTLHLQTTAVQFYPTSSA